MEREVSDRMEKEFGERLEKMRQELRELWTANHQVNPET